MNKRLTKPYEKNVRLSSPLGLLGVPPDNNNPCCRFCCMMCYGITCKRRRTLPQ